MVYPYSYLILSSELTGEGRGIRSKVAFEQLKETVFPYLEKGFVIELMIK
jgi:hypothetical protein